MQTSEPRLVIPLPPRWTLELMEDSYFTPLSVLALTAQGIISTCQCHLPDDITWRSVRCTESVAKEAADGSQRIELAGKWKGRGGFSPKGPLKTWLMEGNNPYERWRGKAGGEGTWNCLEFIANSKNQPTVANGRGSGDEWYMERSQAIHSLEEAKLNGKSEIWQGSWLQNSGPVRVSAMGSLHPTSMAETLSLFSHLSSSCRGFQNPRDSSSIYGKLAVSLALADFAICCSHLASWHRRKEKDILPLLCKMPTSFPSHVHFLFFLILWHFFGWPGKPLS